MTKSLTAQDWERITKVMYSQMNHRPDHKKIVRRICKNEAVATKIEIDGPGSCAVYVQLPDGWWGEWIDVWVKDDDVQVDWNDMYMDDIKKDCDVFGIVTSQAVSYAISKGVIIETEDGYKAS